MTIEFSLRRRAIQAKRRGAIWLSLALIILLGTYTSLPFVTGVTLRSTGEFNQVAQNSDKAKEGDVRIGPSEMSFLNGRFLAVISLTFGVTIISFAAYLLGRSALIEMESSTRFSGLADAICVAGDDLEQFERAASICVPKTKLFSGSKLFSSKDLQSVADMVKQLR
jgi:hypothetical protein